MASQTSPVWFITGCTSGFGRDIALEVLAKGWRVVATGRGKERLADLLGKGGDAILTLDLDVTKADQIAAAVKAAIDRFGGIDVLVNNAGVFFPHPIEACTYEEWQQAWRDTIDINLIGAANAAWCALQHMPRGGSARIVNVGSRGAFRGEPDSPAYGASKAALGAFGQSIAKSLGALGIAVTTLAPGFVDTDMAAASLAGEGGDAIRAQSPFNRVPSAEEVAKAVVFLASPEAEWASGGILDFNGASYLRM